MILTLTWKELREHQGIWLTMAIMTVVAAWGLPLIVAMGDRNLGMHVGALTLLGLTATYGVVCGSMMFAGEHEGGTLVFLDIFHGRRGLLWLAKFAIGCVLVMTQAVAVALALGALNQVPPGWAMALAGRNVQPPNATIWLLVLPVVSLEAYAFGLLGSSFTQRVLAGAAVAAVSATPVWLFAIMTPPPVFFMLQTVVALVVLVISYAAFVNQAREASPGLPPTSEAPTDSKDQFLELWEEFEREDDGFLERPEPDTPMIVPADLPAAVAHPTPHGAASKPRPPSRAPSATEVLWWLTFEQGRPMLWILAGLCLLVGLLMPANAQVLWPFATLVLGVVCGTAAFAPEQRDLSYQFMAAQRFPLTTIWRFKILFWLTVALLGATVILLGYFLNFALRGALFGLRNQQVAFPGTVPELLGPIPFFAMWLVYGFCMGQVFVWLCRKSILAVLISLLAGAGAISLWLPSLLCGGMSGWQLWVPPLILMSATWFLMRAWAGGRIQEHKPLAALVGFGAAATVWVVLNFGYRTIEVPDVGASIDPAEFRAALPKGNDAAAKAVNDAIGHFDEGDDRWLAAIAELAPLRVGVIEMPRANLQAPLSKHLPACRAMTVQLLRKARAKEAGPAFEYLAQILALSRNLRNKAPLEAYLAGVEVEKDALDGLDQWLARGKPAPKLLRRVLNELNRHAAETPPALDCLQTECFRSGGFLLNPSDLVLPAPGEAGKVPERWLTGSIALSLDAPWEEERNARIWQLVWAGLFRAVQTPHWQLPEHAEEVQTERPDTRKILQCWLPAAEGPGAAITRARLVRLVDRSWLSDERLFCSVARLREASTRARCRVDATRLAIALSLYHLEEGTSAKELQDLAPKYLPAGLPTDPYSGQSYGYRRAPGNGPAPGQGIVWSTGPDRIDHGGQKDGSLLPDDDIQWPRGDFDLITLAPQWP